MKQAFLLVLLGWMVAGVAFSQPVEVVFQPFWKQTRIEPGMTFFWAETGDSITITQLRFYICHPQLSWESGSAPVGKDECRLMEAGKENVLRFESVQPKGPVTLRFLIGVDSLTSVSGAMGGDLDPTQGMYWTWNSGYINVKLEGSSPSSTGIKHRFEFHLGGYMPPYAVAITRELHFSDATHMKAKVDLAAFFSRVSLKEVNHVMSPSAQAVRLSEIFAESFSVMP